MLLCCFKMATKMMEMKAVLNCCDFLDFPSSVGVSGVSIACCQDREGLKGSNTILLYIQLIRI